MSSASPNIAKLVCVRSLLRRGALILFISFGVIHRAAAAGSGSDSVAGDSATSKKVDGTRLAIVGGVTAGAITAVHLYQKNAWWEGERAKFHVQEDLVYAKNIDKVGHFYGANVLTFVFSRSLMWANVERGPALIWGAVESSLFQTYIEIEDGFSAYWGFDRVDFAADLLGAWYPVAQEYVPFLQNLNMKFSYLPISQGEPSAIPGQVHTVFDDYEGQTFWLSLNVKSVLPGGVRDFWPSWLALAVGASVRDNSSPDRYLVWYLAPDLDMRYIIPRDSGFLTTLGEALNFIHFPMPAVRISPSVVWYGLYF